MKANTRLQRQVAAIGDMSREELVALWEKQYGCLPPKGIKRGLLEYSAAWHLQARRLGGLSSGARRVLKAAEKDYLVRQGNARKACGGFEFEDPHAPDVRAATQDMDSATAERDGTGSDGSMHVPKSRALSSTRPASPAFTRTAPIMLPPGTRLLREWNGRMYAVDVLEKGFVMDGRTYRSLSAIAKRITGAEWSGPRFFGL